ncbi:GrpB family protein [Bacillus sp. OAE603]|uniref:GrpB family protein n=1 Tax=Gottfriedia sp. OAE603 TaxID=2663872 RepID=UPI0017898C27
MDGKVIIEDYSQQWALEYKKEETKIRNVLGETLIQIEHIGSTSIENLGSKPIIDMMCGVKHINAIQDFINSFAEIGYEFVWHEEFPERRFFRKGEYRAGTHHLHIYEFESDFWINNILFRDYLRKHPDVRNEYYHLKIKLAEKYPNDRVSYTNGKNEFIKCIVKKSRKLKET